jgi:hypothetical protein
MNTDLNIEMPACSKLVIEPICYNVVNGIINVNRTSPTIKSDNVYDINGRVVRAGSTSLEDLPHGIYIVSGKKIVK